MSTATCVTSCLPGEYANMTNHRCTGCPSVCSSCSGDLLCTSCQKNYYLSNGSCLNGCYQNINGSVCISACPIDNSTGYITFADSISQSCVESCPNNYYGFNLTQFCISTCPINYYQSNVTIRCELCINGCNNCTNATYCYSCYPGYFYSNNLCIKQCSSTLIYYYNGACTATCPNGTYLMSDKVTCNNCSSNCATCSGTATTCLKCVGGYLYTGGCVTTCPTNYYVDNNLACQQCTPTTTQCNTAPLTWNLTSNKDSAGNLYGLLTFNRAVVMNNSNIHNIINVTVPGYPASSYTWTAAPYNNSQNIYIINFNFTTSINEENLVVDQL
jgi:hypothetical protein